MATIRTISVLQCMKADMVQAADGLSATNPMTDVIKQRIEAIDTVLSALRAQTEAGKDTNVPTNADRIRAMSDEELNDFLGKVMFCLDKCPHDFGGEKALNWLQQPCDGD